MYCVYISAHVYLFPLGVNNCLVFFNSYSFFVCFFCFFWHLWVIHSQALLSVVNTLVILPLHFSSCVDILRELSFCFKLRLVSPQVYCSYQPRFQHPPGNHFSFSPVLDSLFPRACIFFLVNSLFCWSTSSSSFLRKGSWQLNIWRPCKCPLHLSGHRAQLQEYFFFMLEAFFKCLVIYCWHSSDVYMSETCQPVGSLSGDSMETWMFH